MADWPAEPAGALTVTLCALFHAAGMKVRVAGSNVTSGLSDAGVTVTVTVGRVFSVTWYVALRPCTTLSIWGVTLTPDPSSSVMLTVAVAPALTRSGSVPNPSSTLSPSSSSVSRVAVKVMVRSVCPVAKVTVAGGGRGGGRQDGGGVAARCHRHGRDDAELPGTEPGGVAGLLAALDEGLADVVGVRAALGLGGEC